MKVKITLFHGDTFVLPITMTDSDGTAIDLSGATIKMTIETDSAITITESTAGVTTTREDTLGKFTIVVSDTLMGTNFTAGNTYKFDIELTYSSLIKETLFVGYLRIKDDITP